MGNKLVVDISFCFSTKGNFSFSLSSEPGFPLFYWGGFVGVNRAVSGGVVFLLYMSVVFDFLRGLQGPSWWWIYPSIFPQEEYSPSILVQSLIFPCSPGVI